MLEITFQTVYHTQWGQQLVVVGNIPQLGNGKPKNGLPMEYIAGGLWKISLKVQSSAAISYRYAVVNDAGDILDEEWGADRIIPQISSGSGQILLNEGWRARQHPENAFYNSAFLKVIFKPVLFASPAEESDNTGGRLRFEIEVPRSFQRLQLCILGNIDELGNWDLNKPLLLTNDSYPLWQVALPMPKRAIIQYKYGFYDPLVRKVVQLEAGENRIFSTYGTQHFDLTAVRDVYYRHKSPAWKGSGVAIPVFSLRTKNSFGVGGFSDLHLFIDWAVQVGMKIVQILPINDTSATNTWVDSYPYSSISVFALHPQYLDLTQLEGFEECIDRKAYTKKQKVLNELPAIDYEKVMKFKIDYARKIFENQKTKFVRSKAYKDYFKKNKHWLEPYALFCVLRDKYGTPDFTQWNEYSHYSEKILKEFNAGKSAYYPQILFYYYLQFHLDRQLFSASEYARSRGIVLKGDIAIGIYRNSADAWTSPHLFDMRSQAGAPPDPFSDLGQNWGFPTYRWEVMAKNGYAWWQSRLQNLSRYFDAFRIDHILGFFRIWQIPYKQIQGILGYFNPALPITREELELRGIPFEEDRFCEPYLTPEVLDALFNADADEIRSIFLTPGENGRYVFRKEFADQRKVYNYIKENPGYEHWLERLLKLHAEVLLLRDLNEENEVYHPRIDFQKTFSFNALPSTLQDALDSLYLDYFYHRQEQFWKAQGLTKLPAIKNATDMLICGEDLGMIPACVPVVMRELDLLTLEIQRMSKNPRTEFLQEKDIPYLSVCSTGTHDMSPIRAWWEESTREYISRFYHQELHLHGIPPEHCNSFIAGQIISQHLNWPAMWTIFPLQDLLALNDELKREDPMEERINIPANPNHYWRYRMHITVEDLIAARDLNRQLRILQQNSNREDL